MTTSNPYNDQIPTDPTTWAVLLTITALAIGHLNHDQATALGDLAHTIGELLPLLLIGRR
ncbi:hypothetical protein ACL07V_37525 [Streptomyces sp. MB22_4]|uniref:hypothetical protein n=1 Tax=Streptomyces sp. MB22_4 TaxID=3383120 RepID=UPI0039A27DD7